MQTRKDVRAIEKNNKDKESMPSSKKQMHELQGGVTKKWGSLQFLHAGVIWTKKVCLFKDFWHISQRELTS